MANIAFDRMSFIKPFNDLRTIITTITSISEDITQILYKLFVWQLLVRVKFKRQQIRLAIRQAMASSHLPEDYSCKFIMIIISVATILHFNNNASRLLLIDRITFQTAGKM